ncbi:uncharacterized protein [Halyomorpha halys]|uniref:uncharacterized protein n=1 Tax=Halyomorpha halys TaxID=286706 RepID=UPI0006D4D87A|nr:uncharacterized protein LOC106681970 [Halyomorpha halys]
MRLSKRRRNLKKKLILLYTKPFTKRRLPLVATNDKRYIPSGRHKTEGCSHDYCLAERTREFIDIDENQKPVGLPWASGKLKHLPGHVKVVFPLRKERKILAPKSKKSITPSTLQQTSSTVDKISNPEMCGVIDEILYAYKVFMLAGLIITEAKKLTEEKEETEDDSDDDLS